MRRLDLLILVGIVGVSCSKVTWNPPQPKPEPKATVMEGQRFDAGELMAGPYLVPAPEDRFELRYETGGDGCGDGRVVHGAETWVATALIDAHADGRLQGTVCQVKLPPLPRCRALTYQFPPYIDEPLTLRLPPKGGQRCPDGFDILVLGDTRTGHDVHRSVVEQARNEAPAFIVNLGDIVQLNQRVHEWYQFFEIERPLLSKAPLVVVPGNHETWWDVEFGALMLNRFFRAGEQGGIGHHWRDVGPLRLIFMDAYWGEDLVEEGYRWLDRTLGSLPAGVAPIIFIHEPPISFGAHRPRTEIARLMPLMARHNVAAVIAGHAHLYEHFIVDGTHYVTAGGGGARLHEPSLNVFEDQKDFLVKEAAKHHYAVLEVRETTLNIVVKMPSGELLERWEVPLPTP